MGTTSFRTRDLMQSTVLAKKQKPAGGPLMILNQKSVLKEISEGETAFSMVMYTINTTQL